jgi:hypothetical protein
MGGMTVVQCLTVALRVLTQVSQQLVLVIPITSGTTTTS